MQHNMYIIFFFCVILHFQLLQKQYAAFGAEDGLAQKPPMGWRSWNTFHEEINQELILKIAKATVVKRGSDGYPTGNETEGISLAELGYTDIGIDDNWQDCGSGFEGSFHDKNDAMPLINKKIFPNMKEMVNQIHSMELKAGWYHNNCICRETQNYWTGDTHYYADVNATITLGFDSVKLDSCGAFNDMDKWYTLFNNERKNKIMIENCHEYGKEFKPTLTHCPYHFYRTSADIKPVFESVLNNTMSMIPYQHEKNPLSRPGCWAYPDMLEVGNLASLEEDRSHFGLWIITSSPLILGHDLTDDIVNHKIWPIISNREALRINQEWAGHPGRLLMYSGQTSLNSDILIWRKPLKGGSFAIFVLNNSSDTENYSEIQVDAEDLGLSLAKNYLIYDVWNAKNVLQTRTMTFRLKYHDSMLYRVFTIANLRASSEEV